jgi:hypothetical protein
MTGVLALGPSPLSHIGSPLIGTRSCGGHRADHGQKPRAPWVRDKSVQCLNHRARPARPGNANFRPSSDLRNVRFEADEAATRDRDGWFRDGPLSEERTANRTLEFASASVEASSARRGSGRPSGGTHIVTRSSPVSKRLHQQAEGGRMLAAARVIEVVSRELVAPSLQQPDEPSLVDMPHHHPLRQVGETEAV